MIELEADFARAGRQYAALRDGLNRDLYRVNEMNAEYLAQALADASPVGNYDDEPGHQPVARRPGELADSWRAVPINQYTVAVESTVWYAKLLLFDAEKDSWRISRPGADRQGPKGLGNQREDIMRRYSDKGDLLSFRGQMDGSVLLLTEVERHKQAQNADMQAVLDSAAVIASARSRSLFGSAIQDYLRVR